MKISGIAPDFYIGRVADGPKRKAFFRENLAERLQDFSAFGRRNPMRQLANDSTLKTRVASAFEFGEIVPKRLPIGGGRSKVSKGDFSVFINFDRVSARFLVLVRPLDIGLKFGRDRIGPEA